MTKKCCQPIKQKEPLGFLPGLLYGLLPHTFCIAFVVFSIIGSTIATTVFRRFLFVPYLFQILIGISFAFATISAIFYLKRKNCLSLIGIKTNKTYLSVLYGLTVGVNLLFFMVIFPLATNIKSKNASVVLSAQTKTSFVSLRVAIPCSGHAPLISQELQKIPGVVEVKFRLPNLFDIKFDQNRTSLEEILGLEVFQTYKANIVR